MPRLVIEREIPGIRAWSPQQFQKAAERSRAVLRELGPEVQWVTSDATGDRLYCVYVAPGPELIRGARRPRRVPVQPDLRGAGGDHPTTAEAG
jgi:Protein of unknown function (DUF4242)